ncbi:peroxiredoxin type-2 [Malassezia cuniculi]|uniref:Putative peroxiredoxin n=1 Tax=Malassezia cuniculi TaxID=948313 RepID=A0AAF0ES74_9BASI|nr:peroxiredoxin type-2 [Malassezia cuniculi]
MSVEGQTVPDTTFTYVPWNPELDSGKVCGIPTTFQSHKEFKGKKVVVISVPGAFTPTCHMHHIPPFIQNIEELKAKGVSDVYVIAANDAFVMSAWGTENEAKDKVIFANDTNTAFSKALGATVDLSARGMGERTARYATVIDDLKITYFGLDSGELKNSSYEAVLSKL